MVEYKALLIKDVRIVDPAAALDHTGDLFIVDGTIKHHGAPLYDTPIQRGVTIIDGRGLVACPGFIDLHCHLREPGFEDKETIATGTLAAARGGFTTVCAMPNTNPPADNASVVEFILGRARQNGSVRVLPIGCITRARAGEVLADLAELAQAGVVAFSDDGNPVADPRLMRQALTYVRALGLPLIEHCEDPALSSHGVMNEGWVSTRLGLHGYPAAAEEVAVARNIALAKLTGGRIHLAHISTAGSLKLIRIAKSQGIYVTAEVTPHHLTLFDEWVMGVKGQGSPTQGLLKAAYDTRTKVNPPLRTRLDTEALVEGLNEGVLDAVATDHAPHSWADKNVTYEEAAFGISNLETALASLMILVNSGQVTMMTMVQRLTLGPAQILGPMYLDLATLRPGTSADVTLFDPEAQWTVDASKFASKGKNTPIDGITLNGKVMATVANGSLVHLDELMKDRVSDK